MVYKRDRSQQARNQLWLSTKDRKKSSGPDAKYCRHIVFLYKWQDSLVKNP